MFNKKRLLLIVLSLPVIAYLLFEALYFNATYPNIKLGIIDVGGKNRGELQTLLKQELENRENRTLSFTLDQSKPLAITLNQNLLNYDVEKTIDRIVTYGKTGSLTEQLKQKLGIVKPAVLTPVYSFDEFTFDTILADQLRPYESEVIETKILYNNGQLVLSPSKPGRLADRQSTIDQIKDYINLNSGSTFFSLSLQTVQPRITRENSQNALATAQHAISKQIILRSQEIPNQTWTLDAPQLYDFLEFRYNEETKKPELRIADYKVTAYAVQFAPFINKEPKEAKFETAGTKVIVFEASEDGRVLDTEKLTQQIQDIAFNSSSSSQIELPIRTVKPAVTQTTVNQYGIKDLIASGTSKFTGSSAGRLNNIAVAAEKLNGALIKPNETFSMYATVGDIEKSTGFVDSAIIKNGRTVTGIGGGVCQVSTTLFRAALNAGLSIIERNPHSYRVKYYEMDSPPGLDAAIYFPGQDLKFKNNTENNILIQTKMEKDTATLTINLFGVKDGRTITLSTAEIKNETPPPPEVRLSDNTIPQGIIRQTEFAATGAQVSIKRTVNKDGKALLEDTIVSNYRPWQAVFLIGTMPK